MGRIIGKQVMFKLSNVQGFWLAAHYYIGIYTLMSYQKTTEYPGVR